ncbi:MAG: protein kinase, partial [Clostridiales bacterium]
MKVTDFGIAVGLSDVTQTYTSSSRIMGSVHYISPEQVQGHAVDEKSDIYSVGVVFYEMLTGNLPFTGDTPIRIAMQHVQSQPDAPHHLNPQVPIGISYVVMRAMSKKPSARYASALEMQENIRSVYEGVNAVYQPTLDDEDFQKMSNTMELDPDELPKQDADNPENDDEYEDDQYDDEDDQYDDDDEDEDKEGFWHNHKKRKKKKSKKKKKKNKSHDKKRDDDDNKDDAKANQKNSNNKSKKSSQSNLKRNSLIVLSLVLTATLVFLGFRFFA